MAPRIGFIGSHTAAYYKADTRGLMPGQEERDWLKAEMEFEKQELFR